MNRAEAVGFLDLYYEALESGLDPVAAEAYGNHAPLASLVESHLPVLVRDHGEGGLRFATLWFWSRHRHAAKSWLATRPSRGDLTEWWQG